MNELAIETKRWRGYLKGLRKYKKTIAVDFDGTLSYGKFPLCGPPNAPLIELLKNLIARPLTDRPYYILWTSRCGEPLNAAVKWLAEQGLIFDAVNEAADKSSKFQEYSRKVDAALYVDDKAMTPGSFLALYENAEWD
jgi:hypothetical protein